MTAKSIITDPEKCQACRTCQLQCAISKSAGKTLLAAIQEGVVPRMEVIGAIHSIPNICRHCEKICVVNCPSQAIERTDEGIVRIDDKKCIKCLLCQFVCPFDAIRVVGETVTKCDLCYDRLLEQKEPACVESCVISALKFEEPEFPTQRRFVIAKSFEIPARKYDAKLRAKEIPTQIFDRVRNIRELARIFKVTAAVSKKRKELGLPAIPHEAVADLKKIVETTNLGQKTAGIKRWMKEGGGSN
nr:4Fe-4S dicluster domain-containing protein [Candidatus Njordarchaeota archaeon]